MHTDTNTDLDLGWCQGYIALKCHMEEALEEKKIQNVIVDWCPPLAIFSKKYYDDINELNHEKKYDYCFIGSINSCYERRKWVIDFAKNNFTTNSIFINTDNNPEWELLGSFDYSKLNIGFCPKNLPDYQSKKVQYRIVKDNIEYFEKMCQSKYCLCPAGDAPWRRGASSRRDPDSSRWLCRKSRRSSRGDRRPCQGNARGNGDRSSRDRRAAARRRRRRTRLLGR